MDLRLLTDPDDLRRAYDGVLAPSFPPSELRTFDDLRERVEDGTCSVLAGVSEEGETLGLAIGEDRGPLALLAYLAVAPAARSLGVGGGLLDAAVGAWIARPATAAVLAEVERPDRHEAHPRHGDPARRVAFYARHGARALDLPYFQSALRPGEDAVHGLLLLVLATAPEALSPDSGRFVLVEDLTRFLAEELATGSPAARALGAALSPAGIPLLAPADYPAIPSS